MGKRGPGRSSLLDALSKAHRENPAYTARLKSMTKNSDDGWMPPLQGVPPPIPVGPGILRIVRRSEIGDQGSG